MIATIDIKINGILTSVDVSKLEKLPDGLFANNYNEDGTIDVETESIDLESKRILDIKKEAGEIIYSRYSIEKQSTAKLGIYGQEYLDIMVSFIKDIVEQSNRLELDKTKTLEDFVIIEI